jgi:hypothetical protein
MEPELVKSYTNPGHRPNQSSIKLGAYDLDTVRLRRQIFTQYLIEHCGNST